MRVPLVLLFLLVLGGCARDRTVIRGSFAREGERCAEPAVTRVWVAGEPDTARVRNCRFRVAVRDSGDLVLAFADERDERAWMHLQGVPARARVRLDRVEFDARSLAFPAVVGLEGAEQIEVNGLRKGDASSLRGRVDAEGTVLGRAERGGALLVRPKDERLPDLRVRVNPGAEIITTTGEPGSMSGLGYGEPVRVVGPVRSGVVFASRVIVPAAPRRPAEREDPRTWGDVVERVLEDLLGVKL